MLLALLLQAIYGLRSERLLLEQLDYNLLSRWFVGLAADAPVWHHSSFSKNRERLLNERVLALFLETLLGMEEVKPLLSNEHFSVDGALLQAWASHASLKAVDSTTRGKTIPRHRLPRPSQARAWATQRRQQQGSRRRVASQTSTGSASAMAPIAAPTILMPA